MLKKLYTPSSILPWPPPSSSFYITNILPNQTFTFRPGGTITIKPPPLKFTIRLESGGRRYWNTLHLSDDPLHLKVDHCNESAINLVDSLYTKCQTCGWTNGNVLDCIYCFSYPFKTSAEEKVGGAEFVYIKRENFHLLGHTCEKNHSIDLVLGDDEKTLIKVNRKQCVLCGVTLRGEEMLNFLRLKKGAV